MRILFLSRSLERGGAERQLVAIAKGLHRRGHRVVVAVFYDLGEFRRELADTGIPTVSLEKRGRWDVVRFFLRFARILRKFNPQMVYSFLGPSNIVSVLTKPFFREVKSVWTVRASNMDLSRYDSIAALSYRLECFLSRFSDLVISNSICGSRHAVANGFPEDRLVVIPNGIDTDTFRPDSGKRIQMRSRWMISDGELLVGLIGRIDPMKGHQVFLKAASLLAEKYARIKFVCVGRGASREMERLRNLVTSLNLNEKVLWEGESSDMTLVYNGLDIMVSASVYGEGFSNAVGEAMSCGVPCVVTDVGDSAVIVGNVGMVVSPDDPKALAEGIETMVHQHSELDAGSIRQRIVGHFSLEKLVETTEKVLSSIETKK
ncbi:MAG: glycosyltransferase [Thermodesulfobacteriota bacterium]